jgi:ATP-dependent RNA helicase RhlB
MTLANNKQKKALNKKKSEKKKYAKASKTSPSAQKIGAIFGQTILLKSECVTRDKQKTASPIPQPGKKSKNKITTDKKLKPEWSIDNFQIIEVEGKRRFHDFSLPTKVMHAIFDMGFEYCTPIQAEILDKTLAGRDAAGRAQTGTGKTAAFLITIFTNLLSKPDKRKQRSGSPRALIIAPTRELVMQIASDARQLARRTNLDIVSVFGGIDSRKQEKEIYDSNSDILVATPGRLLDFTGRQIIKLRETEIFIIDEADRMLDMGFIPDVRRIVYNLPSKANRQTLLFSATLTPEVNNLASQWTKDSVSVQIEPEKVTVDTVEQIVYLTENKYKNFLLYNIITNDQIDQAIIFGNRRDETRRITDFLKANQINCALLSGDVSQNLRIKTLDNFKSGNIKILIATDVAGRGIHVEGVSHVINYNLPYDPEDYVHRIGRTGRAGKNGISISFACEEDSFYLPDIEEYIGHKLKCTFPAEELLLPSPVTRVRPTSQKTRRSK